MRKLIAVGVLALGAWAGAESTPDLTGACENTAYLSTDYSGKPKYDWIIPAKFPSPTKSMSVLGDFEIACPTYHITSKDGTITLKSMGKLADISPMLSRSINLFYKGRYKYPALQLDWLTTDMTIYWDKKDSISTTIDDDGRKYLYEVVAAYRIDGGELQPLVFEGKLFKEEIPIKEKVEIYLKPTYSDKLQWSYFSYDNKDNLITLKREFPFPEK